MKKLTEEKKTEYTKIALALAKIATDKQTCELIWRSYEGIQQHGGRFSLEHSSKIQAFVDEKYNPKNKKK